MDVDYNELNVPTALQKAAPKLFKDTDRLNTMPAFMITHRFEKFFKEMRKYYETEIGRATFAWHLG